MTPEQKERLRNFIDDGEKEPPPVFVGRENILDEIIRKSVRAFAKGRSPQGSTRVIQGAPGAGKSSLLSELSLRSKESALPRVVKISDINLKQNIPNVIRSIALTGTMTEKSWAVVLQRYRDKWAERLEPLQGLALDFNLDIDLSKFINKGHINTLIELEEKIPSNRWHSSVILAVDEAQNLPPGNYTPHADFLQSIHNSTTSLPITQVLAGLSDTQECVLQMGMTNGVRFHTIGCLSRSEQIELIDKFCDHFGIEMGSQRKKLMEFFAPTNGWPRHMYWAQQALAEILLDPDIDGYMDNIEDWVSLQKRRDEFRIGYYQVQTSPDMESSRKLLAAVLMEVGRKQNNNERFFFDEVKDAVIKHENKDTGSGWQIPEGLNAQSYLQHLIRRGVLQKDSRSESYVCPIPSFQSYLIKQGGLDPENLNEYTGP